LKWSRKQFAEQAGSQEGPPNREGLPAFGGGCWGLWFPTLSAKSAERMGHPAKLFVSNMIFGVLSHQTFIERILVVSVPNSEGFDTYLSFTEFLLHYFVKLFAIDVGKAMLMGEGCLRNVDFPDCRLLNIPVTGNIWHDMEAS
jgi:hypothetical protein